MSGGRMQRGQRSEKSLLIPPRWLHCPRKGALIERFLPFKTPLDSRYDDQIPEECRFNVDMLFDSLKSYNIKLGLIVDLTNTDRFYNRTAIEQHDCRYVKLPCKGHGEAPTLEYTQVFVDLCERYLRQDPLHVIGVHCTHGFNRSGLLIISYLVQKQGWSVDAALMSFSRRRPPGIYKQDYINEIANRFPDFDQIPVAPALPDWCTGSDDRDDDGLRLDDPGPPGSLPNDETDSDRRREFNKRSGAQFMDGQVAGHILSVGQPQLKGLQRIVQDMCGWAKSGFPGAQPVSMTCRNLEFISRLPYKVSWKADGTRYMMYIKGVREVYMVDRDNNVFNVPDLTFPRRKDPTQHITSTLLDGEMIFDEVNGLKVPRYLIYDIVKFEGLDVGQTDFDRRLLCIDKEIIRPRTDKMTAGGLDRATQPFSVRIKPFFDLSTTILHDLIDGKFSQEVAHKTDGLIFQATTWRYIGGRCQEMLKWKPAELNSMDFQLRIVREQKPGMMLETKGYLHVGGMELPFALLPKVPKDLMQYNGKIVECTFDAPTKQWRFMRPRVDKSFPNSLETAKGVCESIERPVTKQILYDYIDKHRWRPQGSERILMLPPTSGPLPLPLKTQGPVPTAQNVPLPSLNRQQMLPPTNVQPASNKRQLPTGAPEGVAANGSDATPEQAKVARLS